MFAILPDKINPSAILRAHTYTLHKGDSDNLHFVDLGWSYVFPVLAGLCLWSFGWSPNSTLTGQLVTASAIFSALLLNLLILVDGQRREAEIGELGTVKHARFQTLQEIVRNISFAILVSVLLLIVSVLHSGFFGGDSAQPTGALGALAAITGVASVVLSLNLALTMLMILKRFYLLTVSSW